MPKPPKPPPPAPTGDDDDLPPRFRSDDSSGDDDPGWSVGETEGQEDHRDWGPDAGVIGPGPTEGFWRDQFLNRPMPKPDPSTRPQEGSTVPPAPPAPKYNYPDMPLYRLDRGMVKDPESKDVAPPYKRPNPILPSESHMGDYYKSQNPVGPPEVLHVSAPNLTWDDFPLV
jgi:hypothetical protein